LAQPQQAGVDTVEGGELLVAAALDHAPALEHGDRVGVAHGHQVVRDHDRRPTLHQASERVEQLVRRLRAGNIYVNRRTTGAVVARQPFGGNGLSGTGARTGSVRYLWRFTDDQVVCENTLRHGLELG
jgi:hypothetical protein